MTHITQILAQPRICGRFFLWLLPILLLSASAGGGSCAGSEGARVVVILANYLSMDDYQNAGPHVSSLLDESAVGLMNTGAEPKPEVLRYLTLGCGMRPRQFQGPLVCVDVADSTSPDPSFARRGFAQEMSPLRRATTGGQISTERAPHNAVDTTSPRPSFVRRGFGLESSVRRKSVVCLGLDGVIRANRTAVVHSPNIGLVGDVFHAAGLRTAVVGNSDTLERKTRHTPLVAVDRRGMVDGGTVGRGLLRIDPQSPGGLSDNVDAVLEETLNLMRDHALVVVELGDFNRVYSSRERLTGAEYRAQKLENLKDLDALIGEVRSEADRRGMTLILCSPCPECLDGRAKFAPVVVYTPGGGGGLLTSASTRTAGLISNVDFAPAVLRAAGLRVPVSVLGQPATGVEGQGGLAGLEHLERTAVRNIRLQIPFLGSLAVAIIFIATASEIFMRSRRRSLRARRILSGLVLWMFSLPPALILLIHTGGEDTRGLLVGFAASTVIALAAILAGDRMLRGAGISSPYVSLASAHIVMAVVIIGELLLSPSGLQSSIIPCGLFNGVRYYGLGNEYMGMLIGAGLLAPVLLALGRKSGLQGASGGKKTTIEGAEHLLPGFTPSDYSPGAAAHRTWFTIALLTWFLLLTFLIGYARLGANFGGLITAIATFGVAVITISGERIRSRHAVALLGIVILGIALFLTLDLLLPGGKGSHLGRLASMVRIYGWDYLRDMVAGKMSMHLGIILKPQTYLSIVGSIPFLVLYSNRVKAGGTDSPTAALQRLAMPAAMVGVVVAFLFNDSGIVPASLIFASYIVSTLYLQVEGAKT